MYKIAWLFVLLLVVALIASVALAGVSLADGPTKPSPPPTPLPTEPPTKRPPVPTPEPIVNPTKPPPPPTPTPEPTQSLSTVRPTKPSSSPAPTVEVVETPLPIATFTLEPTQPPSPTTVSTVTPAPLLLEGRIFDDQNQDGTPDPEEPGISGVAVLVDDQVATVTDEGGHFSVPVTESGSRALLSIRPPEGWEWSGSAVRMGEAAAAGGLAIALYRVRPTVPQPVAISLMSSVLLVVLAVIAGGLLFVGFSVLLQSASVKLLERTYRRHKSLELEQRQAQAVARRRTEVEDMLDRPDGWERVIDQLLADALPETGARVGTEGVLDLAVIPVPRFTVVGADGGTYLFTTAPGALRRVKILGRHERVVPLDASVHPAARVEVQAVWEYLAEQRLQREGVLVLPRQAAWFLVVRRRLQGK